MCAPAWHTTQVKTQSKPPHRPSCALPPARQGPIALASGPRGLSLQVLLTCSPTNSAQVVLSSHAGAMQCPTVRVSPFCCQWASGLFLVLDITKKCCYKHTLMCGHVSSILSGSRWVAALFPVLRTQCPAGQLWIQPSHCHHSRKLKTNGFQLQPCPTDSTTLSSNLDSGMRQQYGREVARLRGRNRSRSRLLTAVLAMLFDPVLAFISHQTDWICLRGRTAQTSISFLRTQSWLYVDKSFSF